MDDDGATTAPGAGERAETVGHDEADADDDRFDDPLPRPPIEPEAVDPENAAFVVLGALLTVAILVGSV